MEFESAVPPEQRSTLPSRVEDSVDRVLALLAAHGATATFFIVGQVAEQHAHMVRRIAAAQHEIACHSYCHELVFRQTPQEFRLDVRQAKAILEDETGTAVIGYRAPNYSITTAQSWAYDILLEEGFRYDSSVYPISHDRYGYPNAPRFPYPLRGDSHSGLIEFPIGTVRLWGRNFPIGGGGYFRLFPEVLVRYGIQYVNGRELHPVMFYFHPWELDPDQPHPPMPWHHRFRHYVGISRQETKLARLFNRIPFRATREILGL
jgi:polysaccharide deacetylase family protein (PEP-CTERM system associated)